jgi:uncharacterized phage protein gp47/JayE
MADFSLARLPAQAANGTVTFSRLSSAQATFIPIGTVVRTSVGLISFSVTVDANNPAWQTAQSGYLLAIGVRSLDLPVHAVVPGVSGNVLPNTITVLASAISGVDFVNNDFGTSGGADSEADTAFRTRFASYFLSRPRATLDAIGYAMSQVRQNLNYVVEENKDANGNTCLGSILIVVDDGSGILSDSLLSSVSASLAHVRPLGTTFLIQAPQVIPVQVSLRISYHDSASIDSLEGVLTSAISEYVNGRPIGGYLSVTRISQLAYQVVPDLLNVSNVCLNGETDDLIASPTDVFKAQCVKFT